VLSDALTAVLFELLGWYAWVWLVGLWAMLRVAEHVALALAL